MNENENELPTGVGTVKTLGERRVRTTFNTLDSDLVDQINQKSAELINLLEAVKNDEVSKTYDNSPEYKEIISGEKLRLVDISQTKFEEAVMWAVKAVTLDHA